MTNDSDQAREAARLLGTRCRFGRAGAAEVRNRFAAQPMEANDGDEDGNPMPETIARYVELARGGAGLIFIECTAVSLESRGRTRGLVMNRYTLPAFQVLARAVKQAAEEPLLLLIQLNHGGRFSHPRPLIAHHHPLLDPRVGLGPDSPTLTTVELRGILDDFAEAAALSREAGFDGADFKACHGYLGVELLRPANDRDDEFGGEEDNRFRFLEEGYARIRAGAGSDWLLGSRISLFEGIEGGLGADPDGPDRIHEPSVRRTLARFAALGPDFINHTAAVPYVNPELSRPQRGDPDPEQALAIHDRLIEIMAEECRDITRIGSVFSYYGPKMPEKCAELIEKGLVDLVGPGRQIFADPAFAAKIIQGRANEVRWCRACAANNCSALLKNHLPTGCAVYNDYYKGILRQLRRERP